RAGWLSLSIVALVMFIGEWRCAFTKPGTTRRPRPSITRSARPASASGTLPTATIRPSSMRIEPASYTLSLASSVRIIASRIRIRSRVASMAVGDPTRPRGVLDRVSSSASQYGRHAHERFARDGGARTRAAQRGHRDDDRERRLPHRVLRSELLHVPGHPGVLRARGGSGDARVAHPAP